MTRPDPADVERLAKAMYRSEMKADGYNYGWQHITARAQDQYRQLARVALRFVAGERRRMAKLEARIMADPKGDVNHADGKRSGTTRRG